MVVKLRDRYYGDDFARITIPQTAFVDASDSEGGKGYEPIIETDEGEVLVIQPIIEKSNT